MLLAVVLAFPVSRSNADEQRTAYDIVAGDDVLRFWAVPDGRGLAPDPVLDNLVQLQILRAGAVVLDLPFQGYASAVTSALASVLPYGLEVDATGDGQPDYVLASYSGGAHCCLALLVITRDPQPVLVDRIKGGHSQIELRNLDADPALEALVRDWTFAYWPDDFARSYAPRVVLDLGETGRWVAAAELMRAPAPSAEALAGWIATARAEVLATGQPTLALRGPLLDLLYSGNGEAAWTLLDGAWPASVAGRDSFLAQLCQRLLASPHRAALASLNGWCSAQ